MTPTKPIRVTQVAQATALSSKDPSGVEGAAAARDVRAWGIKGEGTLAFLTHGGGTGT
ncbi:hypothetical protein GCM10009665_44190 [Kitasatospora nipponensis]|uniref:Uncharacterized protein n=1 Tax=Kitasatospora nipponensis TaxID=258049 RepID=A0ABN1WI58_9ACTN